MQIIDEKSLIKKYQTEIRRLKEELEQLKMGIITGTPSKDTEEDNIILWKQKVLCCLICVEHLPDIVWDIITSFSQYVTICLI